MVSQVQNYSHDEDGIRDSPTIEKTISSGVISLSPELFEKLYLTPKVHHSGDNINRFSNPTPLGFVGFVISVMTYSMITMGWGGASGFSPVVGIFFFVGPVLLILTTIFEWIMGNFFPMMACGIFSVFWLSFGVLQLPTLGLAASYSASGTNAAAGSSTKEFNAVLALFLVVWGFAFLTFFICTIKTNVVLAGIFLLAPTGIWLLSAAYWKMSLDDYETAAKLEKAGGAVLFVMGLLGWYSTFVMMAAEMGVASKLPVGDLSHFWATTDLETARGNKSA